MQSRYYNPTIGRFLNADALCATGQGLLGNNMFAYCKNSPVILCDPSGTISVVGTKINHMFSYVLADGGGGYNIGHSSDNTVSQFEKILQGIADYYKCDDEQLVLQRVNRDGFAFYNGVFVVKTNLDTSFSYGFIGLSAKQQNVDTLKHEYGHAKQFQDKGIVNYTFDVAIPSLLINALDRCGKLPYDYYSYPFEAEANALGGVVLHQKGKNPLPQGGYSSIWDLIVLFFM